MTKNEALTKIEEKSLQKLKVWAIEEQSGERSNNYQGPLPRPLCDCKSWGCWGCCLTEQQMKSKQGIFS